MKRILSVRVEQRSCSGIRVIEERRGLRLGKRWGPRAI